jgi:CubicO group peptidase (beta-lactamase class C family)
MMKSQIEFASRQNLTEARFSRADEGDRLISGLRNGLRLALLVAAGAPLATTSSPAQTASAAPAYRLWRGNPVLQSHGVTIDQMIADFVRKHQLPGIAMAIVQAPYIPRSAGYGVINVHNDELASTKTMWNIGPITQGFTAVAIMQLKEQGKLSISDPIAKYLPDAPAAWGKITTLELMQHASGIPDFRNAGYNAALAYSPSQLIDLVRSKPLLFEAGTEARLSATNFILLGMIIERAGNMSYHDFIDRYQIKPLHLESSMFASDFPTQSFLDRPGNPGFNQHDKFKAQVPYINPTEPATGYIADGASLAAADPAASANLYSFGGIWSSAQDISLWDIALAGGVLIKDEGDRDIVYKPTTLASGKVVPAMAGWEFTQHGFMEVKGDSPGFSSYLSRFTAPDDLVCVTLLTNKQGVDLTGLAREIADAYKSGLGADVDPAKVITQESKYSVPETVARIKAFLAANKVPVFATYDHAANAEGVGLSLRPTEVVVFGNPKVGTKLMQQKQAVAIDLPLRVSVWEDDRNRVWLGYQNMNDLGAAYEIKDETTLNALDKFLGELAINVANVYAY